MTVSRGGGAVIAAGPTELRRYLPISVVATGVVAGLPLWAVFALGERLGLLATVLSVALSFALAHLGTLAWKRWPGSRDVVFNDLMLWGFVRRIITQKRLIRRVERLGFSSTNDPDEMTIEERTKLLKRLAEGLETGDPYTHGHSQRVARHAYMVAKTMKLSRRDAEKIRLAAVIHDVGKLRIPREIITKPGKLTDAEFDVIKRHTVDGAAMVEVLGDPEVTDMVRHHHERLDGSGYPDKLAGDEISIGARVLAVADTFDAASSLRPYRPAQEHKVALDILEEEARAGRLDPVVVDAFIRYYSGRRALKWWTFLSAGPAHLHDIPLAFLQRAGAVGIANAAVVGVTAVALAPGSPLQGGVVDRDALRRDRTAVIRSQDHNEDTVTAAAATSGSSKASKGTVEKTGRRGPSKKSGSNPKGSGKKTKPNRNNGPAQGNLGVASGDNKGPKEDRGKPSDDGESEETTLAETVDDTTEAATGPAAGAGKNDGGDGSEPVEDTTEETTDTTEETVTDEVETVPAAPGNSGDKSNGKDK